MSWTTIKIRQSTAYYLRDVAAKKGQTQWQVLEDVLRELSENTPRPTFGDAPKLAPTPGLSRGFDDVTPEGDGS